MQPIKTRCLFPALLETLPKLESETTYFIIFSIHFSNPLTRTQTVTSIQAAKQSASNSQAEEMVWISAIPAPVNSAKNLPDHCGDFCVLKRLQNCCVCRNCWEKLFWSPSLNNMAPSQRAACLASAAMKLNCHISHLSRVQKQRLTGRAGLNCITRKITIAWAVVFWRV